MPYFHTMFHFRIVYQAVFTQKRMCDVKFAGNLWEAFPTEDGLCASPTHSSKHLLNPGSWNLGTPGMAPLLASMEPMMMLSPTW